MMPASGAIVPEKKASPRAAFLWTFIPLLFLYGATRARTVTGEDSGELITAAWTLDVAHPPGYPLWLLVTRCAQGFFRGLNPANAASLSSAITMALAMGILAVIALRFTRRILPAITGALLCGIGHEIWNHGTIAEVYPLNLLLLLGSLHLFLRWRESPTSKRLFVFALVYGAGLTHHPTFQLFLPVFAVGVLVAQPQILRSPRKMAVAVLGLALPFLVYLQVYLAAEEGPWVSWGVRPDLASVFAHFVREVYWDGAEKTPQTFAKVMGQAGACLRFMLGEYTLPGTLAAIFGLGLLWRRDRLFFGMSAAIVLLSTFAIIPVTNFDIEREDLFATRVFLMPAYVLMGVGLAVTLAWASRSLAGCPRMTYSAALAVCPAIFVIATYADHDRSDYFWIEDYGRAILKPLPKDTVLIPSGDVSTFPLLYLQAVEGFRKDIHLIDRAGTLEREEAVRFLPDEVVAQIHDAPRDVWVTALLSHGTRPVATLNKTGLPQAWVLEPCGMAFLSVRAEDKGSRDTLRGSQAVFMRDLVLRNEETPTVDDYSADVARAHIEQVRAREALAAGNPPRAMEHLEQALAFGKGIKELANNIGALLAENDLKERAAAAFQAALRIRPDYRMARRNLMITLAALGQHAENLAVGEVGLRFHPKDDVLFEESIRSAKALKDGDALRGLCAARAAALPHDPKPDRALADWEMEQGNKIKAQLHLARAAQKAPLDEDGRRLLAELEADLGLPPTVMGGASEASSQGSSPTDTLERLMAKDLLAGAGPGPGRPAMGTPTQTYTPIPGVQDISALGTTVNDPRMTSDLRPHLGTAEQVSNPLGATQIAPSGRSTER